MLPKHPIRWPLKLFDSIDTLKGSWNNVLTIKSLKISEFIDGGGGVTLVDHTDIGIGKFTWILFNFLFRNLQKIRMPEKKKKNN